MTSADAARAPAPAQGSAQGRVPGAQVVAEALDLPGGDDHARAHGRLCLLELVREELAEARVLVERMEEARQAQDQRLERLAGVLWPMVDRDGVALSLWQDVAQLRRRLFGGECPLCLAGEPC